MDRFKNGMWSIMALAGLVSSLACSGLENLRYQPRESFLAEQRLQAALLCGEEERPDEMAEKLEELIVEFPQYVEAHRQLQNFYLSENRKGFLENRYRQFSERHPDNAAFLYLHGRVQTRAEKQIDSFQRAVAVDRSFFWGYNGLGYACLKAGQRQRGESAFKKAMRSAPERVEPYLGLITLYLESGDLESVEDLLGQALERFPDDRSLHLLRFRHMVEKKGALATLKAMTEISADRVPDEAFFALLLDNIDKGSTEELVRRILNRFAPDRESRNPRTVRDLVLGVCCRKLGNLNGGLRYFSRAYASAPELHRVRRELRYLLAVSGRMPEALALQKADFPEGWLAGSRLELMEERIVQLAEQTDAGAPQAALELAEHLRSLGWLDEAAFFLNSLADGESEVEREAATLLDEIYRHNAFESALRDFFLKQYRTFRKQGDALDFEEGVEALGRISQENLGLNIFTELQVMDFSPVGMLMDPRPASGSSQAVYFRRFNRFFIVGKRVGGPLEGYLLDLLDYDTDQVGPSLQGDRTFDLVKCEHLRIPSYIEYGGAAISGAALVSFVFVNVDSIRQEVRFAEQIYQRFKDRETLFLGDPPPLAAGETDRLDLSNSYGVGARLEYLAFKLGGGSQSRAAALESWIDAFLSHEVQHLADADTFLPITNNFFWKVYHFALLGFNFFNVEAWLEERAQLHALYTAANPHAVLATTAAYLERNTLKTPHRQGYRSLIGRMVDYIHEHEEAFPTIDARANLLHQLHRLTPDEVAGIARALALEEGLIDDP